MQKQRRPAAHTKFAYLKFDFLPVYEGLAIYKMVCVCVGPRDEWQRLETQRLFCDGDSINSAASAFNRADKLYSLYSTDIIHIKCH